jgi:hypothetical protein
MQRLVLTEQQKTFFDTFGFLMFPGLMADRIEQIIHDFEEAWKHLTGFSGQPHDGTQRSMFVPFLDQHPGLCSLLDDPRIDGIASSLLGDDYNFMASDGNYYAGDTRWHSDGWHTHPMHAKIAFYLDPLTRDSGCLRVIPGSHIVGDKYSELVQAAVSDSDVVGLHGRDIPAIALETVPGDICVFNHNTKHAAFGGGGWRRMFTMNLCQRYPEAQLPALRDFMSAWARNYNMERGYGEVMISTAGPERMRHLEQVLANDGHMAELCRQARAAKAAAA